LSTESLLDAVPDAVLVVNRAGEIVVANVRAEKLFGYSHNELIGRSVESLIPPRLRAEHPQHRENFFGAPRVRPMNMGLELFALRKDATEVPVEISLSPLTTESDTFVISAIRDVTDRRRTEELKASEERSRRLVQSSSVAMIVSRGLEQKVELMNDKFTALFGYTVDDVPDVAHWWPLAYPDEAYRQAVRTEWQARVEKAIRNVTDIEPMEGTVRCKDGSTRHIEAHLACMGDTNLVTLIDLTERKRAEDAVRESEARYRRIIETTNEGVWLVDSKVHTSYVNQQMAKMLGHEPGEMVGRSVFDFYFPEDFEHKKQALKRRQQGLREQIEERLRRSDGSELWVRMAVTPLIKDNGEFDGALAMVSDITERKRQEAILRESEERLRVAAEVGRMYAWEWDPATDSVLRSAECADILGLSDAAGEGIAKDYLSSIHPDDRAELWSLVDALTPEHPVYRTQYRRFRPDGALLWLEESGCATFGRDGKMVRLVGMTADITERKRAEEALRESEKNLAAAQARAHLGSWVETLTDHKLIWSDELYRLWGLQPRSVEPNRDVFLRSVHPDDRAYVREKLDASLENQQSFDCIHRVLRPDGSVRFAHAQGESIVDNKGQPVQFVGTILDITERKLAEEALASVSRRLIEAQEQERTRIARDLHDDFGQRLALLTIELELLQQKSPDLPAKVRSRIGELGKQTSKIATDIQSLSHELHSSKLEYVGIAAAMRGFCQEFGEQQKAEIDFKTHDLPSPLSPDISLGLFRVLQEALHNATKHSGVRHFEVSLWGAPGEIHLTVSDSGSGFNREATKESRGLGLISMEERLKLLDGTFSIESQPKRGTRIHACVPLSSGSDSMRAAG